MREILGRRRRLLPRWNLGLRSGGNDERSGGTGSARADRTSSRANATGAATASGSTQASPSTSADGLPSANSPTSADNPTRTSSATSENSATSGNSGNRPGASGKPSAPAAAALTAATEWKWPVVPGVGLRADGSGQCGCADSACPVPGAHPLDPDLLAATTDERMVRWWWTNRPTAPVVLATGGRAPCAVSLPAVAGARAVAALDRKDTRLGPVLATRTRWSILVAPYTMEQLGDLLFARDFVPGSLRFHGDGGYVALPSAPVEEEGRGRRFRRGGWSDRVGRGGRNGREGREDREGRGGQDRVRWERAPLPGSSTPWVPGVEAVVDAVVDALTDTGVSTPEA